MMHSIASHSDSPIEGAATSGAASAIPMQRRNSRRALTVPTLTVMMHGIPLPHRLTDTTLQGDPFPPKTPLPLHALIPLLPPLHTKFFELLDSELEKIDSFYAEREKEMQDRGEQLKEQLNELVHRQKFYESNAKTTTPSWPAQAHRSLQAALFALSQWNSHHHVDADKSDNQPGLVASESGQGGPLETVNGRASNGAKGSQLPACTANEPTKRSLPPTRATGNVPLRNGGSPPPKHEFGPQEYQHAKKSLKKAAVEYYRGLEVLNNYRILNLTGFRKALKKYGKVTKVSAQAAYMKERVEPSAFASGATVSSMLREMEELFAVRFERGDKKKAITRLRVGTHQKSHHFSTFRTGMWLGSCIPATVAGLILSQQGSTRLLLPSWDILLFIYSILLIPVLLALLVGLNLVVWARERINYVFIFGAQTPLVVYVARINLLLKNSMCDLDLTIESILRFGALVFCEVH
ncbi:hypothetical protein K503DRAFT_456002 [Rhizopogon vinicolor AM-OR11-026]|uniref:SPX domain-containing protein n=1 Tax=Rhizopogon vinicolor AM-OR11-026 TaxID=1314800 RepID=A0A1B7MP09_9AGAM|nr:hypothetical protein K503DRAFT_456002 [Rhizopogon vinicolor AM-OR11-026]